jgi:hypothetical protein
MDTLILNSLEIRRFRSFEHLMIERQSHVNLVIGKKCSQKHKQATGPQKLGCEMQQGCIISGYSQLISLCL